jgi:hypothetical protein
MPKGILMPNKDRLQMIQAIITRLATNSAALKGFTVPTLAALLGVSVSHDRPVYALLGYFVIVSFGVLDAYYLALEQAYRRLYDTAVTEGENAWGLSTDGVTAGRTLKAIGSASVYLFYGAAAVAVTIVALSTR